MNKYMKYNCQYYAVLAKKSAHSLSVKWLKRFYVVKDGFLLYYDPDCVDKLWEKQEIDTTPNAVMPLNDCTASYHIELDRPYCVNVISGSVNTEVLLSMARAEEQEELINIIQEGAHVNCNNRMIRLAIADMIETEKLFGEKPLTRQIAGIPYPVLSTGEGMKPVAKRMWDAEIRAQNMLNEKRLKQMKALVPRYIWAKVAYDAIMDLVEVAKLELKSLLEDSPEERTAREMNQLQFVEEDFSNSELRRKIRKATAVIDELHTAKWKITEHLKSLKVDIRLFFKSAISLREAENCVTRLQKALNSPFTSPLSPELQNKAIRDDIQMLKYFLDVLTFRADLYETVARIGIRKAFYEKLNAEKLLLLGRAR